MSVGYIYGKKIGESAKSDRGRFGYQITLQSGIVHDHEGVLLSIPRGLSSGVWPRDFLDCKKDPESC
jgi:hypothetical protein